MEGPEMLMLTAVFLILVTPTSAIVEEITGPFCSGMDYLLVSFCNNPEKAIECGDFRHIEEFQAHPDPPDIVRFKRANINKVSNNRPLTLQK